MRKIIPLLLALVLALSCSALAEALPEGGEAAYVTAEEIDLFLAGQDNSSSVLLTTPETADLRGIRVGASLDEVLAAYPDDNPILSGTYYEAALYIAGEQPEMSIGYILRDGQRVDSVNHLVLTWEEAGVAARSVAYTLDHGAVTEISVGIADGLISKEEAQTLLTDTAQAQEISEYFAYPVSENGESLARLEREDLSFRALAPMQWENAAFDFLDLNYDPSLADASNDPYDAVITIFGTPQVDEWTEDSTGEKLRTLQWDGVSLVLVYDSDGKYLHVDSLTVNKDVAEGPRGVRIGDLLDEVIFRFRHVEEYVDGSRVLLYGDGQEAPYGVLSYTPESAEVTYALDLNENAAVIWHLTFGSGALQSMSMLLR